jgi:hypothetical protein
VQTLLPAEEGGDEQVANAEEGKREKGGVEKEGSQQRGRSPVLNTVTY